MKLIAKVVEDIDEADGQDAGAIEFRLRYRGGCNAFMAWNKARIGKRLVPVQGLTNRRARERAMCLRGIV